MVNTNMTVHLQIHAVNFWKNLLEGPGFLLTAFGQVREVKG